MPGREFPQVNSEGRVRARLRAPDVHDVQLDISGVRFPMTKDAEGVSTGDSTPQDPGNHYYGLVVDGAQVPDPDGSFIYGSGAWHAAVEIPAHDQDFYALKNVPHGQVQQVSFRRRATARRAGPSFTRRPITTRTRASVIRCSICNMAAAKMKPAGAARATPA